MSNKLVCPFCGEEVKITVCDDEGNIHPDEYEQEPYSGLGYLLIHEKNIDINCPIATEEGEPLGMMIYDSREEATETWNQYKKRK